MRIIKKRVLTTYRVEQPCDGNAWLVYLVKFLTFILCFFVFISSFDFLVYRNSDLKTKNKKSNWRIEQNPKIRNENKCFYNHNNNDCNL